MLSLEGKSGIVFGANGGLGQSVCEVLASLKADCYRVTRSGTNNTPSCDISSYEGVSTIFSDYLKSKKQLDFVVNCAGITLGGSVIDTSVEDWNRIIDVNLNGAFYIVKKAAEIFKNQNLKSGAIVLIGSPYGVRFVPNLIGYCVSKSAISSLAKGLSVELAEYGVRVNTLIPGMFPSPMTNEFIANNKYMAQLYDHIPDRHLGDSRDLAKIIACLLSDEFKHVNGADIVVDGGYLNLLEGGIIR